MDSSLLLTLLLLHLSCKGVQEFPGVDPKSMVSDHSLAEWVGVASVAPCYHPLHPTKPPVAVLAMPLSGFAVFLISREREHPLV